MRLLFLSGLLDPPLSPAAHSLGFPATSTQPRFLIDGFPRKMDQAIAFDRDVCPSKAVLFFSCTEEIMQERLMERGKTSGRDDDNKESIIKRFRQSKALGLRPYQTQSQAHHLDGL